MRVSMKWCHGKPQFIIWPDILWKYFNLIEQEFAPLNRYAWPSQTHIPQFSLCVISLIRRIYCVIG